MTAATDFQIGRGDNAPDPIWQFNFDLTGSNFELSVTPIGGIAILLESTSGALVVDTAAKTVTWPITSAQSNSLPLGRLTSYTLRRIVPGGETRYYAQGMITALNGPVDPSVIGVIGVGPQGPAGPAGSGSPLLFPIKSASSFTASHGLAFPPRAWLIDATGAAVDSDMLYGASQVTVTFAQPFTGTLYLG